MNCINHPEQVAAGTCNKCGKALCAECMNRFSFPLCEPCLLAHNDQLAKKLYFDIGLTCVLFLGVGLIAVSRPTGNIEAAIIFGLIASSTYWGWQFLSLFSVSIFFTSGFGVISYIVIKAILSMLFGFLVAPWQLFKRVKEIKNIREIKRNIEQKVI